MNYRIFSLVFFVFNFLVYGLGMSSVFVPPSPNNHVSAGIFIILIISILYSIVSLGIFSALEYFVFKVKQTLLKNFTNLALVIVYLFVFIPSIYGYYPPNDSNVSYLFSGFCFVLLLHSGYIFKNSLKQKF